jgi:phage terminase large subunit-like protein
VGSGYFRLGGALPVIAWPEKDVGDKAYRQLRGASKIARLQSKLALIEGGQVYLPGDGRWNGERLEYGPLTEMWVKEFVEECSAFDGSGKGHDDQVDCMIMALWRLSSGVGAFPRTLDYFRRLDLVGV